MVLKSLDSEQEFIVGRHQRRLQLKEKPQFPSRDPSKSSVETRESRRLLGKANAKARNNSRSSKTSSIFSSPVSPIHSPSLTKKKEKEEKRSYYASTPSSRSSESTSPVSSISSSFRWGNGRFPDFTEEEQVLADEVWPSLYDSTRQAESLRIESPGSPRIRQRFRGERVCWSPLTDSNNVALPHDELLFSSPVKSPLSPDSNSSSFFELGDVSSSEDMTEKMERLFAVYTCRLSRIGPYSSLYGDVAPISDDTDDDDSSDEEDEDPPAGAHTSALEQRLVVRGEVTLNPFLRLEIFRCDDLLRVSRTKLPAANRSWFEQRFFPFLLKYCNEEEDIPTALIHSLMADLRFEDPRFPSGVGALLQAMYRVAGGQLETEGGSMVETSPDFRVRLAAVLEAEAAERLVLCEQALLCSRGVELDPNALLRRCVPSLMFGGGGELGDFTDHVDFLRRVRDVENLPSTSLVGGSSGVGVERTPPVLRDNALMWRELLKFMVSCEITEFGEGCQQYEYGVKSQARSMRSFLSIFRCYGVKIGSCNNRSDFTDNWEELEDLMMIFRGLLLWAKLLDCKFEEAQILLDACVSVLKSVSRHWVRGLGYSQNCAYLRLFEILLEFIPLTTRSPESDQPESLLIHLEANPDSTARRLLARNFNKVLTFVSSADTHRQVQQAAYNLLNNPMIIFKFLLPSTAPPEVFFSDHGEVSWEVILQMHAVREYQGCVGLESEEVKDVRLQRVVEVLRLKRDCPAFRVEAGVLLEKLFQCLQEA